MRETSLILLREKNPLCDCFLRSQISCSGHMPLFFLEVELMLHGRSILPLNLVALSGFNSFSGGRLLCHATISWLNRSTPTIDAAAPHAQRPPAALPWEACL